MRKKVVIVVLILDRKEGLGVCVGLGVGFGGGIVGFGGGIVGVSIVINWKIFLNQVFGTCRVVIVMVLVITVIVGAFGVRFRQNGDSR